MADTPDFTSGTEPTLQQLIDYAVSTFLSLENVDKMATLFTKAHAKGATIAHGAQFQASPDTLEALSSQGHELKHTVERVIGWALSELVGDILGVDVPPEQLGTRESLGESGVGHAVGDAVFNALRGTTTALTPGADGAKRLMAISAHITLHSWFVGIVIQKLEKTLSVFGQPIESIAKLGEELVNAMGVGRLARVALRPLAQITMATPLEWDLHKTYRPTMLTPSTVARQWQRGRWSWEDVVEELARAGYSDARIDAIINEQRKFLGVGEVRLLEDHGVPPEGDSLKYLGEAGYDQADAELFLRVEGAKQIEALNTTLVDHIATAYANRVLTARERDDAFSALNLKATRLVLATELADTRRALNKKFLTASQVAEMVPVGILGFADYRDALTREGYDETQGAALELLLRHKVDTKHTLAEHQQQMADDRAAAKQARADAAAKREADAMARAALAKRGSLADNKAAAVRGLIPMSRYQDILAAHYNADTVTAMIGLAESARQDYLTAQAKRDAAAQRAADTGLNVGQLETAVLEKVLTIDQFQQGLQHRNLTPADVDVLVASLKQRVADRDAAVKQRAAALQKSQTKHPPLATMEQLVRAGHRTLADYDGYLVALGYDDAGRAAIEDLLKIRIAQDQKAADARAAANAALKPKGLSVDQLRRAVILGVKSIDDYTTFLTQNKFTADAVAVLVAEAKDAAAQAAVVRARRGAVTPTPGSPRLPLATVARAARLGLITISAYTQRLTKDGYSADDIALEVDLLTVEIAATQAARDEGGAALLQVNSDITATLTAAQARAVAIEAALKQKHLSLAKLEAAVTDGQLTLDDYITELEQQGFDPDDAELLGALLGSKLAAKAAAPPPASGKVSRTKKPKAAPAG